MSMWSRSSFLLCTLLLSAGALASLTEDHLETRLRELGQFRTHGLDLEAFEREAAYERANLSLEKRAELEAQRMVEQLRFAALSIYQAELEEGRTPEEARAVVRANMDKDMYLLSPDLQGDIRREVEAVLRNPTPSAQAALPAGKFLQILRQWSADRRELLEQEPLAKASSDDEDKNLLDSRSRGPLVYNTRRELLNAMANDQVESERWVATSNIAARSGVSRGAETEFSAQVSAEFLGVKLSAGPVFKFKKYVSSYVDIKGEGLYPLFDGQGRFDFNLSAGRSGRRFMFFTCEMEAHLESEAAIKGGFKVMGVGGETQLVEQYKNDVSFSSRRVLVPDTLDGRSVTVAVLAQLCHNDFKNVRTPNNRTVGQNLDTMVRNLVSGLTYVNPAMQCVTNNHCVNWYNREVLGIHKYRTVPRCLQERGNQAVMTCQLRGGPGANCRVVRDGKVVSSGMFEYTCDRDHSCVVSKQGGWGGFLNLQWIPWEGRCRSNVINVQLVGGN